jgi:hypothetical protein
MQIRVCRTYNPATGGTLQKHYTLGTTQEIAGVIIRQSQTHGSVLSPPPRMIIQMVAIVLGGNGVLSCIR